MPGGFGMGVGMRLLIAFIVALATASAARIGPPTIRATPQKTRPPGPTRLLFLISDTGGGHRASAEALRDALEEQQHNNVEVSIVDLWTEHAPWAAFPYNKMVPQYRFLARRATTSWFWRQMWRLTFFVSVPLELPWALQIRLTCGRAFKNLFVSTARTWSSRSIRSASTARSA